MGGVDLFRVNETCESALSEKNGQLRPLRSHPHFFFFLVSRAYHTIPERAESKIPVLEAPSLSPHMGETEGGHRPIYKNI